MTQDDSGVFEDDFEEFEQNNLNMPENKKTKLELIQPKNSFTSPKKSSNKIIGRNYCSKSADYHSLKKSANSKIQRQVFPTRESCKRVLFAEESDEEEDIDEELSDIKRFSTNL